MNKKSLWDDAENFLLNDKYIGLLVKKFGHCKIKQSKKKDYFLDLVDSISSQQLSGKAALSILNRLKEKLGGKVTAENILKLKDQEIRDCGMSWAKAKYLKDLAEKVKSSKLKIKSFNKLSDEEIMEELIAVKGIGKWTAKMFLMFTLARQDIFPEEDLGINRGVKKLLGRKLKSQELAKFAERWKPFRTAASWYVWKILDN